MSALKVLFYVQHLLGIGHLRRTATLSRNMVRAGLDVTIVSGGHKIDIDMGGAKLEQLPATRATDLFFKELVDDTGQKIDDSWKQRRADILMDIWRNTITMFCTVRKAGELRERAVQSTTKARTRP